MQPTQSTQQLYLRFYYRRATTYQFTYIANTLNILADLLTPDVWLAVARTLFTMCEDAPWAAHYPPALQYDNYVRDEKPLVILQRREPMFAQSVTIVPYAMTYSQGQLAFSPTLDDFYIEPAPSPPKTHSYLRPAVQDAMLGEFGTFPSVSLAATDYMNIPLCCSMPPHLHHSNNERFLTSLADARLFEPGVDVPMIITHNTMTPAAFDWLNPEMRQYAEHVKMAALLAQEENET